MKVGQVFDLPTDIRYELGHVAKLRDKDTQKLIGKYEVIQTREGLKGRVIVTYGHKRAKK